MTQRPHPHLRVIKLGGSLLDVPDLAPTLRRWLARQPAMASVMIVGGGPLADVIREAFGRHGLSQEAAHWLCVRVLGVTAELVARLLPEARFVRRLDDLLVASTLTILDPESFLRDEPRLVPSPLPHSWDVTSDSIAARLAAILHADELVLLKSDLPPTGSTLCDAATASYVDPYFPFASAELPAIRCVNLRAGGFPAATLS